MERPAILVALEGSWVLSHKRSEPFEDVLKAQSVGWVVRKLVSNSTPRVHTVVKEADGVWILRNTTSGVGPTSNTRELRLDGAESPLDDPVFGPIITSATISEDGNSIVLRTRSEKNGWSSVTTWSVVDGVQERRNEFKSPTLEKTFVMRYERDV